MTNDFKEKELLEKNEAFAALIHRALKEEPTEFKLIVHKSEYKGYKQMRIGVKKAARVFATLINTALINYTESAKVGKEDINTLLACKEFYKCVDFYVKEYATVDDMIKEYKCYRRWGHYIRQLLGAVREERDMVDYRTLPISFF